MLRSRFNLQDFLRTHRWKVSSCSHPIAHQSWIPRLCQKAINLVVSSLLLRFLLEPALLNRSSLTGSGLALDFDILALVGLQFIGKVGLLGGLGRSRNRELLDVGLSVAGLDRGGLVGLELFQVELLNEVG